MNTSTNPISLKSAQEGERIKIFTGVSCKPNPGPGAFCTVILRISADGKVDRKIHFQKMPNTNVMQLELHSAIAGLSMIRPEPGTKVELYTRAAYIPDAFQNHVDRWQENGWHNTSKKPVANIGLWKELLKLCGQNISFIKARSEESMSLLAAATASNLV
jgi:ribonuclease HI